MPSASHAGVNAASPDPRSRRVYPRRRNTYPAAYLDDVRVQKPAYGLDISGGGICLLTREPIPQSVLRNIQLLVMVGDRKVRFTGAGCWAAPTIVRGTTHYRYGVRLTQIADGDWEYVMEHSLAGEGGPQLMPGALLTDTQRASILPFEKQQRVAEALANAKRLDVRDGNRLPLVEYTFHTYVMQRGTPYYRLLVRSKTVNPDRSTKEHRTSVLVAVEGDTVNVLD